MSRRQIALITPSVIKWAREYRKFSTEEVAHKLKRPEKEIIAWENGEISPSLAQARNLSELYKISLAVFYLPEPPRDFSILKDFRKIPSDKPKKDSPQLSFLISGLQDKQEWLKEYFIFEEKKELEFIGSARLTTPTSLVAKSIREHLSISADDQINLSGRSEFLRLLIRKAENIGISISRQGRVGRVKIDCIEIRGLAICDKYAPFIFVNSNDAKSGQIFTLIHELAHLWINQSGISNISDIPNTKFDPVEVYCNKVAGEFLLTSHDFWNIWDQEKIQHNLLDAIRQVADKFKVSPEAVSRKLLDNDRITDNEYEQLRKQYQQDWIEYNKKKKEKQKDGFASPNRTTAMNNSYLFTQVVVTAYNNGIVSGRDASVLLGAKINNFEKIFVYALS